MTKFQLKGNSRPSVYSSFLSSTAEVSAKASLEVCGTFPFFPPSFLGKSALEPSLCLEGSIWKKSQVWEGGLICNLNQ